MAIVNALPTLEAPADDEEGVNAPGALITQRYPAIARYVELCRRELRESGMLALKQQLDKEVLELRIKNRTIASKTHEV
jgi:hypothetical protein